jgi:hypothetical protein
MHDSRHRLCAYCVDTPLNLFWLRHALELCDDVFVDQLASVRDLAAWGVKAAWLPLCVMEADFRPPQPKEHFLTFVGRVTPHRAKRRHLLDRIERSFPVTIASDISQAEMISLFARSRVVLNENFFDGLTLRVFQGLASGALVFTEAGGTGVDRYFTDGEHLVCFTPDTLLARLEDIAAHPERYETLAARGQEACRAGHTSAVRARELLACLADGGGRNPRRSRARRCLGEALALYGNCRRFGGVYSRAIPLLEDLAAGTGRYALEAAQVLGSIHARRGDMVRARGLLVRAARAGGARGFVAAAKLALIHLDVDAPDAAVAVLTGALAGLPGNGRLPVLDEAAWRRCPRRALYLWIARVLFELGVVFELGFEKRDTDNYPDCAFEYAWLAWEQGHGRDVLDCLVRCARHCRIEHAILPVLATAIAEGIASDRQIAVTAELAFRCYDTALASGVTASLQRLLAARRSP